MAKLTKEEIAECRDLYAEFWRQYPGMKNPTDINCREKAYFLIQVGFERIALMQRARKLSYPFTKAVANDQR